MSELELPVALVGEGDRFDALGALLKANKCDLRTWRTPDQSKRAPKGMKKVPLEGLADIPLLFIAAPLTNLRMIAREIGDVITPRHAVLHACHNLESHTTATASEVLLQEMPTRRFGFITGPMRPEDVRDGRPASGVCASRFPQVWELAEAALVNDRFRLYRTRDLLGAEHAAAYGRVMAMAAGVASTMQLGHSVQATLFARGLAEMSRWVGSNGGEGQTTFGISGAANLFLDSAGDGSTDFQVGVFGMQQGVFDPADVAKRFGPTGADLLALVEALWEAVQKTPIRSHILEACHLMVSGELDPQGAVIRLMTLPTLDD